MGIKKGKYEEKLDIQGGGGGVAAGSKPKKISLGEVWILSGTTRLIPNRTLLRNLGFSIDVTRFIAQLTV